MRLARRAALTALVLTTTTTVIAAGGPAFAAPPGNDTYAGRVVVGSVPFAETRATTEATIDADDSALSEACGQPLRSASVWYELTPASDTAVVVDVSKSDYSAGVIVATGSPGHWNCETWARGSNTFSATAGTQYTILADRDHGSDGRFLDIRIETRERRGPDPFTPPPPPPPPRPW